MTLTRQEMVLASKETMGAALSSVSSTPAPAASTAVAVAVAVSPQAATAAVEASVVPHTSVDPSRPILDTVLEEEEPKVHIDKAVALALEGISLAISMDNSFSFLAMSLVSHELETLGEPP